MLRNDYGTTDNDNIPANVGKISLHSAPGRQSIQSLCLHHSIHTQQKKSTRA